MIFVRAISLEKAAPMQQLTAILLRRAWKRQGNDLCFHPSVEPEYERERRGDCVCSVCGSYVESPPRGHPQPVQVDREPLDAPVLHRPAPI
ncbi:MAG: hypothetical protein U0361_16355 [Nitrospiraceae bacterium]